MSNWLKTRAHSADKPPYARSSSTETGLVGTVEVRDMDQAIADFTTHLRDRNRSPITVARYTDLLRRFARFACAELHQDTVDFGNRHLTVRQSIVNGVVGVPKNYRERTIPLTADALAALTTVPRRGKLVFTRENGTTLSRGMSQNAIKHACRRAGIQQIGWHVLRHTFASTLAAAGTPITSIQALLGHSSIVMTMRYTHTSPSTLRDAVAVLENRGRRALSPGAWAPGGQRLPFLAASAA